MNLSQHIIDSTKIDNLSEYESDISLPSHEYANWMMKMTDSIFAEKYLSEHKKLNPDFTEKKIQTIEITNNCVSVKDALKAWIGAKYDENDYKNFLKMKKINCTNIFLSWHEPRGGGYLSGGPEYVDLKNETVDKTFLSNMLENALKIKPGVKLVRKIKNVLTDSNGDIENETCDLLVPYDDDMNTIAISVWKD